MTNKIIGIDIGSRTTKIVQMEGEKIIFKEIFDTGQEPLPRIKETLAKLDGGEVIATGYGRHLLSEKINAQRLTEIKACAMGVNYFYPECRLALDMGGQDCKVVLLDDSGKVADFEMNDRCAAGTGRFFEVMAHAFGLGIEPFIELAMSGQKGVSINNMCTVFAESEVISLISSGKHKADIALALHRAAADRLTAMISKFPIKGEVAFVGGGAKNKCLVNLLETSLKKPILIPEEPEFVVAIGAGLLGDNGI